MVGRRAEELEQMGIFDHSSTVQVLKTKKKETVIQTTAAGRRLMVTGIPMFNSDNNLYRVINISRDITEVEKLKSQLNDMESLLAQLLDEIKDKQILEEQYIIGKSKAMKTLLDKIKQVSKVDVSILLLGETGVGKGLLAKTIHKMSHRRDKPFVQISCGAIPENLLESELFGYEEGAFTGAKRKGKKGLFEIASNGTILLDEVSEIPANLQVKLLNLLQEKEVYRVGGTQPIKINGRLISTTNKDLKNLVQTGKFREDLYYRLNIIPLTIPPLCDRLDDIPMLACYFIKKHNKKYGKSKNLTSMAYNVLLKHNWPGNIRELENALERMVVTCENDLLDADDVINTIDLESQVVMLNGGSEEMLPLKSARQVLEKSMIERALNKTGSTRKAAKLLGIDQSTLVKKMKKYAE